MKCNDDLIEMKERFEYKYMVLLSGYQVTVKCNCCLGYYL